MPKDLRINVNAEYFHEIRDDIKPYEFRLYDNDFWQKRLIGKKYDTVTIALGYPKKTDKERNITFPYRGYEVMEVKHRVFDNKIKKVFAIKVGNKW